jgi:retron-type reverse transcriptase
VVAARVGAVDEHAAEEVSQVDSRTAGRAIPQEGEFTALRDLGRGVSGGLRDLRWREHELRVMGMPLLRTPEELASALGMSLPRLRWLAYHAEDARVCHYHCVVIPKRSGGERVLTIPQRALAQAQRWILREILDKIPVEPSAHGFIRGRSIVTNAQPHAKKHVVINVDLRDFFGTIPWRRARRVFERLGYSRGVATVLALLCTEAPRQRVELEDGVHHVAIGERVLPQGACTSPALANAVARRLDRRLGGLARCWNAGYTRYADDLTFSGDEVLITSVGRFLGRVRRIIREEGFEIQEAKTRVMRRGGRQVVTGLVVNDRPKLDRARLRRIRAILHQARATGLQAQDRVGGRNMRAHLRGMLANLSATQPELACKMREELEALED